MAENVYIRQSAKNIETLKKQIIEHVNKGEFGEAKALLNKTGDLHLGRFTVGYRFVFALNPDLYDINDSTSISRFLHTDGLEIVIKDDDDINKDLPGREINVSEFIDRYNKSLKEQPAMYGNHEISKCGACYYNSLTNWF